MRSTASVVYGIAGQTLELRAPQGRPSSASFAAYRDSTIDGGTAEFSGTATIDTVNTTVSSASGDGQADPQRINLTSTAGIVTIRKYLIAEASKIEVVAPIEVQSGYIRVRSPLNNAYTNAATFVGTTMVAAVDDTWAATAGKLSDLSATDPDYRMRWTFTVAGVAYTSYSFFDLVREAVAPDVDIDDVNARAPGLLDSLPKEYRPDGGRGLIASAWRMVRARLVAAGLAVDAMRDDEGLDELVILATLKILADGGWSPASVEKTTWLQLATTNFENFIETNYIVAMRRATAPDIYGQLINGQHAASFEEGRRGLPYWYK